MKDKTTTIDDLARMINEGFKSTASKEDITRVEVRMDGIESRLGRIGTLLWPNRSARSRIWKRA